MVGIAIISNNDYSNWKTIYYDTTTTGGNGTTTAWGGNSAITYTDTYSILLERTCLLEHRVECLEKFVEDLKDFAASKDIEEYLDTILEKQTESEV